MAPRAISPALSENEFDIGNALLGGEDISEAKGFALDAQDEDGTDDEAFIAAQQAASNRRTTNKGHTVKKGGGWQNMGLSTSLLKQISRKGFSVPTPIQRKTIPMIMDNTDVVAMARTGSGKTAAFVIPLIEKLKAHSARFGARAIVLSPSRELALQTLKVIKEFGRGTDLRTILLTGGDSLEEQFSSMSTNPDIIVASPGRLLHLVVEMNLELSAVQYIVFDEADRLYEAGFATQLGEILHKLPSNRQTLLFSATLPSSLVEFARAGLQDPKLVRLDSESKISPDLENAFFTVKGGGRDGALLHILDEVIKMPMGETEAAKRAKEPKSTSKKRKRGPEVANPVDSLSTFSTIIFAATKHRVEYLTSFLRAAGYSVSYVYGSLDQTARKINVQNFRAGFTNLLVVTDVAARGIDLPLLANVIQYDFPSQPKIFVHRVGRVARAGRRGCAYSLLKEADVPYLIDLQLFLAKPLVWDTTPGKEPNYATELVVGTFVPDKLSSAIEFANRLVEEDENLKQMQDVAAKGESQYVRTRNSASSESVKRAKAISGAFRTHPLFALDTHDEALQKEDMLSRVSRFRPSETVFEIGKRSNGGPAVEVLRKRREQLARQKKKPAEQSVDDDLTLIQAAGDGDDADPDDHTMLLENNGQEPSLANDSDSDELEVSVSHSASRHGGAEDWKNSEYFMSYTPQGFNQAEERGYGVQSGSYNPSRKDSNFVEAARDAQMNLTNDETRGFGEPTKTRGLRWDKKSKKYVARANDEDGSKGKKMVIGESGMKIPASFRSGRFDDWRKSNKIHRLPRTGQSETQHEPAPRRGGRVYKHKLEKAPKDADRYRDDYHVQKRRVEEAKQKRIGKFKEGGGRNELRDIDDVRKQRKLKDKRREKNARPSKKRKL
ncbi:ATP-dependent RNA helicase DBP10 [Polyplosphaeria fusca]|uniref:RNA helicase n=1 Tax=Polyplosphaeria fusca TaxID=682080 RepID=A0A9P4R9Y5_9PLEO|nr:ATP-dependent RNA helicase DBP10 [Polyplosphaeria fusca]